MKIELDNKKKKLIIALGVIVLVVIVGLALAYWKYQTGIKNNLDKMKELSEQVTVDLPDQASTDLLQQEEPEVMETIAESEPPKPQPMHDYEALKQENSDIYAWISMPDTKVDYPVLQSETDNKYLDTNIDGSKGYPGCIYSNMCNSKDFDDYITVLYGHNMKNGEMFGSLHSFNDAEFFNNYETYTVETPKASFTYSIYAVVNYNDKLIPAYYDVKSTQGRDEFVSSLEACRDNTKTHFRDDMEISGEDKLLVLSLCIAGQDTRRYLVVSKLEEVIEF